MSPQQLGARIERTAAEWPMGGRVWHRADGKRGVIVEYTIDGQGCVMIVVCWGANTSWDKCSHEELSAAKISDGTDGDEWKDESGKEGEAA